MKLVVVEGMDVENRLNDARRWRMRGRRKIAVEVGANCRLVYTLRAV